MNHVHVMDVNAGVDVELHSFLTSAQEGVSDQLLASAALPPGKGPTIPNEQEVW
jgi:hypothetical protein